MYDLLLLAATETVEKGIKVEMPVEFQDIIWKLCWFVAIVVILGMIIDCFKKKR